MINKNGKTQQFYYDTVKVLFMPVALIGVYTYACSFINSDMPTLIHMYSMYWPTYNCYVKLYIVCASISRTDGWPVCPCISPSHNLYSAFEH